MGLLPTQVSRKQRDWRTRPDPLEEDWETVVLPLLKGDKKGALQSTTIIEELKRKRPEKYHDGQLRTVQRRVRDWRAIEGPNKEVFFPQEHVVSREAQVDFTHATQLGVSDVSLPRFV